MATPRSWRRILDLPPIDWALLAAERSRSKRHTPASIAKMKAGHAKRKKAKRKAARIASEAKLKPTRQAGKVNALGTLVGVMAPGQWYGRSDMQTLSGLKRGTVAGTIIRAEGLGLIERTKNPAWERQGGLECEFLYRRIASLDAQVHDDVGDKGQGAGDPE